MKFAHPHVLWLLALLLPGLLAFFWWSARRRQRLLSRFIQTRLLPGLTVGISMPRERARAFLITAAAALLVVALARPQWGFTWEETKQKGLAIVIAIDTSKSMLAEDIAPNRLTRAKLAALDLMQQAHSDRLGLVAFAGTAFLQCPMTFDDAAFRQSVDMLDVNVLPQGGTAIADAIDTARGAFKEEDSYKVLVLFTDGEDHDSGAVEAAKKAAAAGLRIFTVGVGSAAGELLQIRDAKGRTETVKDDAGNAVMSRLNEPLLQEVAQAGNGFYLPLRGANTVDTLYAKGLAPLPKSESEAKLYQRFHEQFHWPLALGILLLIVEFLLPLRKREKKAVTEPHFSKPALAKAAVFAVFLAVPGLAAASPGRALRDYQAGRYDQALSEYERLLEKHSDDPRLAYNAGAAAYQDGRFEEAVKHFDQAASAPDLKLQERAYYNRGNASYRLGEGESEAPKKMASWEKAVQDFESTLKLNPQDTDAQFNRDFVKRRLEELKQQQQQQQDQKQDKKDDQQDKQDKQDQKDQQQKQDEQKQQDSKDQQKQDQQKQDQQQKDQQKKEQQDQKDQQQSKQDQQKQEDQRQQQAAKEQQQKDQQQSQKSSGKPDKPEDQPAKEDPEEAQPLAPGQLSPQQARRLLDLQKGEEKMLPLMLREAPAHPERRFKDW